MPNYNPIIPKFNATAGTTPAPSELEYGELAINLGDGNLYTKKSDDTIVNINTGVGGDLVVDYTNLTNVPTSFTPVSHSHTISDVTNLQTVLDNKQASGSYAAAAHTHDPSEITGTAVVDNDSRLTDDRTPVAHNHGIDEILNLQSSLDSKENLFHTHTELGADDDLEGCTAVGLNSLEYLKNNSVTYKTLHNTAIGFDTLEDSYGEGNTAVGSQCLTNNTTGYNNHAVGYETMFLHEVGVNNIAMGYRALYNSTSGNGNVVIGFLAGDSITASFGNTLVGTECGRGLTIGIDNTVIGKHSDFTSGTIGGVVALGAYCEIVRSNELVLGSTTTPLITSTSVGGAGSAASLPGSPLGYLEVRLNGSVVKVPYYN